MKGDTFALQTPIEAPNGFDGKKYRNNLHISKI